MGRFRKRPVLVEAIRFDGDMVSADKINAWAGKAVNIRSANNLVALEIHIHTLEGTMIARVGDWIIRGVNGEFYPCKPDIFEATYEAVE